MELIKITDCCYYFKGAVNIGYIKYNNYGILVDSGIDPSVAKKVMKIVQKKGIPFTHLFITHAHADHYGGAAYLQEKYKVTTIAPPFEEAILTYPQIHTMLLNSGNDSNKELQNKFLQGQAVKVDKICNEGINTIDDITFTALHFPGHSHFQMGLLFDNILYAADSYFGKDALKKHGIPFIVDAEQTMETLNKLLEIDCLGAVPGHGEFENDFSSSVQENILKHEEVYQTILLLLKQRYKGLEEILSSVCLKLNITLNSYMSYSLYRTSINAYVTKGINRGDISYHFENNKLLFTNSKGLYYN
ncbi:MBL fold metallo-hydrolase [Lottiidibacillus patelloidae]|nr:MBL fold metallo-hydrolase [Lottiidibacillus patelloidae]